MASERTIWHPAFTRLLIQRGPAWAEVRAEVPLVDAPLVVDDVIELRASVPHDPSDTGTTLRGLWPHVVLVALLEFKSISRTFRRGDLYRLLAYGWLYLAHGQARTRDAAGALSSRLALRELTLVLVVPALNAPLMEEIAEAGMTLLESSAGYLLVGGHALRLLVIDLTNAAAAEGDELMGWFGNMTSRSLDTRRWVRENMERRGSTMNEPEDLDGFDDWVMKLSASLTPEQRLEGLSPEERSAGLSPDETLLVLSDELLRRLPESFLATVPEEIRARVRARLGS